MKLKVIDSKKDQAVFIIEGITEAIANTVRREATNNVPTLAIEEVTMQRNSSVLYDEMLAHRLGLVPLKTDLKSYKKQDECSCKGKGCAQCTLVLSLKAKGPSTVYSSQIESKDPKVKPAHDKMIIVKLLKNQEIKLDAKAILSNGRQHAKFSPGLVFYKGYPTITIEKKLGVKACLDRTSNLAEKGNHLVIKDLSKWSDSDEEFCEKNGMLVEPSKTDFIFTVEAWGQLTPKEMLLKAVESFDDKLDEFSKQFKKL